MDNYFGPRPFFFEHGGRGEIEMRRKKEGKLACDDDDNLVCGVVGCWCNFGVVGSLLYLLLCSGWVVN